MSHSIRCPGLRPVFPVVYSPAPGTQRSTGAAPASTAIGVMGGRGNALQFAGGPAAFKIKIVYDKAASTTRNVWLQLAAGTTVVVMTDDYLDVEVESGQFVAWSLVNVRDWIGVDEGEPS